jgi:hypothetical protein
MLDNHIPVNFSADKRTEIVPIAVVLSHQIKKTSSRANASISLSLYFSKTERAMSQPIVFMATKDLYRELSVFKNVITFLNEARQLNNYVTFI